MRRYLTQKRLKEVLDYNPKTGIFTWIVDRTKTAKTGVVAGSNNNGYIQISVDGILHRAHRLVWLYTHGYLPENEVDHINRNRSDNRITNLRHVSRKCNSHNCKVSDKNSSGVAGISWDNKNKKWVAQIYSGKQYNLGRFKEKLDAVFARWKAEIKYGFSNCLTSSSSYNYLKRNSY